MSTSRELINDLDSSLNKAGFREPLFLLRAQDVFFEDAVEAWIERAEQACAAGQGSAGLVGKIDEAKALLRAAQRWPNRKVPD